MLPQTSHICLLAFALLCDVNADVAMHARTNQLESDGGDSCELLHVQSSLKKKEVVVINKTAGGPYCYEVPNASYAERVILMDPLASLGGKAAMYFDTTCPRLSYSTDLGYDPVFTSAKLYTHYSAAQTWQQALLIWNHTGAEGLCGPHGGPYPGKHHPFYYYSPVPYNLQFVPCTSTFALCYYAKCVETPSGTAKCGCFEGDGMNMVDVNVVMKPCLKMETLAACPQGQTNCSEPNSAPFCKYMKAPKQIYPNADLISDWFKNAGNSPMYNGTHTCSDPGKYAQCMTAPCKREPFEMDGVTYNVTCECPIRTGPYAIAAADPQPPCDLPEGQLWSAASPY